MQPVPPPYLVRARRPTWAAEGLSADVGEFRQGTAFSQWALARFLVGRVIADAVSTAMWVGGVTLFALAVVVGWLAHLTVLAVLLCVVAVVVLLARAALQAVLRRLYGGTRARRDARLRQLLGDTRRDTLRELRRVGLPGRRVTVPVLAVRLVGRRRQETLERLREFDVEAAVPKSRLDEVHLLLAAEAR